MTGQPSEDTATPAPPAVLQLALFPEDEHVTRATAVDAGREAASAAPPDATAVADAGDPADAANQAPVRKRRSATDVPAAVRPQATVLGEAIPEYLEYLAALNRSKHTLDSFGLDLRLLLQHLGNVPLSAISERDLRSFISWVRLQRHNGATSVRRKVASLKNFFSYLRRERVIADDPSLRLIYPEINPPLPEFLEDSSVDRLLAAAEEHLSWHALLVLMLETGLKRDEVVALGKTDVHLADDPAQASYLVVRETEQAKRLRSRRLDIGSPIAALLLSYLAEQVQRDRFFDLSPRGVNFIVETCGNRARIATKRGKLTPQVLRETYAVRQMRAMQLQEDRLRAAGTDQETMLLLVEQHDLQLLRLLGLQEEPESAKKYRKLARGWTMHEPG